ncbi:MAG: transglycosylase SLT domain-containing protein, partial [Acidobacteria bacterium]|nr:transglycosylase SLT domain-containing protein [Acidobacteriota bacterium]MDW7983902.1 transglycosylase SLT domain-containing protein [Acidobacteriota bacterium]
MSLSWWTWGGSGFAYAQAQSVGPFPLPPELEPTVQFWVQVFTQYSGRQALIVDADAPHRILRIVVVEGVDPTDGATQRAVWSALEEQVRQIRAALDDLDSRGAEAAAHSPQHRWLWQIYGPERSYRPLVFQEVRDRLRIQWGHKEKFQQALQRMYRFLPHVRAILTAEGLPPEIAYLPLIESGYNPYAASFAGARGLWQLMPTAARKMGLTLDTWVDQRLDPLYATVAAARYLKQAYQEFGNWPLAITSYNHGLEGIRRAVRQLGTTDYVRIWREYRGPLFGFASRNFYPEFLAAVLVAGSPERYFPGFRADSVWEFATYVVPHEMSLRDIPERLGVALTTFIQHNPQFLLAAYFRNVRVSAGTSVRMPLQSSTDVAVHVVRPGETLAAIARLYGVSVDILQRWNPLLLAGDRLRPGI